MINAGETVRVSARPFDWQGLFDQLAYCSFTYSLADVTSEPIEMEYVEDDSAFLGEFTPDTGGVYNVRVASQLSDGSVSVERRRIEVRG